MKVRNKNNRARTLAALLVGACALLAMAESDVDVARKTQNPIADLIGLPLQFKFNYGSDISPFQNGNETLWIVKSVIPFDVGLIGWSLRLAVTFLFSK